MDTEQQNYENRWWAQEKADLEAENARLEKVCQEHWTLLNERQDVIEGQRKRNARLREAGEAMEEKLFEAICISNNKAWCKNSKQALTAWRKASDVCK